MLTKIFPYQHELIKDVMIMYHNDFREISMYGKNSIDVLLNQLEAHNIKLRDFTKSYTVYIRRNTQQTRVTIKPK